MSTAVIIAIVVVALIVTAFVARRMKQRKREQRTVEAAGHRRESEALTAKAQEHDEKATELEDKL